jgi:hypothetical protein
MIAIFSMLFFLKKFLFPPTLYLAGKHAGLFCRRIHLQRSSEVNGISPEMTATAMDVAVMKKHKEVMEQQGEAAVQLIQSAEAPPPARVASPSGLGRLIDVYI